MSKASEIPHNESWDLENLMTDLDGGKVDHKLSPFYTRPLYKGTKMEQGGIMRRTAKELTDVEIIDAFEDIIDIVLKGNNEPIRKEFERYTRCTQIGYDIELTLKNADIIEVGENYRQEKLKI